MGVAPGGESSQTLLTLSLALAAEILGSTSPLSLDPLRYLSQRWFSPQALTFLQRAR